MSEEGQRNIDQTVVIDAVKDWGNIFQPLKNTSHL